MRRFDDLTYEELIVLTEQDIERFIEIEIAHEGIMTVLCPALPSLETEGIVASEIAYEVGNLLFKNEADAVAVASMETLTSGYDYNAGGYDYKWLNPVVDRTVVKRMFYKQTDIARIKEILQRNKAKREDYEKRKNDYDNFLKMTGRIRDSVYRAYYDALEFQREIEGAKDILERYKQLADGDEVVANNFFRNTYKSREDIIEKVLGKKKEVIA